MAEVSLPKHMREHRVHPKDEPERCGPFITISRQYGCWGFSLGSLLLNALNEEAEAGLAWSIYNKEILERLAHETNVETQLLERLRRSKPKLLVDFVRSLSGEKMPSGHEVLNRITTIIRGLAMEGRAIIVGQGGAGATADLPNGLSVRLEAPEEWRVRQTALREKISESDARARVLAGEQEREYLRRIYETRFPRRPAFHITYDCSAFTLEQVAQHILYALRLKGCI
jgi:hypothetical protein